MQAMMIQLFNTSDVLTPGNRSHYVAIGLDAVSSVMDALSSTSDFR